LVLIRRNSWSSSSIAVAGGDQLHGRDDGSPCSWHA
jgi:hypothetical protein